MPALLQDADQLCRIGAPQRPNRQPRKRFKNAAISRLLEKAVDG
jgi:hypothetical protein